jgi:hypothetical protein
MAAIQFRIGRELSVFPPLSKRVDITSRASVSMPGSVIKASNGTALIWATTTYFDASVSSLFDAIRQSLRDFAA